MLDYVFWETEVIVLSEVVYWMGEDRGSTLEETPSCTVANEMSYVVPSGNPLIEGSSYNRKTWLSSEQTS